MQLAYYWPCAMKGWVGGGGGARAGGIRNWKLYYYGMNNVKVVQGSYLKLVTRAPICILLAFFFASYRNTIFKICFII